MVALAALALLTVTPIDQAFDSMYNSDFSAAQRTLNGYIAEQPEDPLGYCVRAAAYLFGELDRLLILDGRWTDTLQDLYDAAGYVEAGTASNCDAMDVTLAPPYAWRD